MVNGQFVYVTRLLDGKAVSAQVILVEQVWEQEGLKGTVHQVLRPDLVHGPAGAFSKDETPSVYLTDGGVAESARFSAKTVKTIEECQ